MATKEDRERIIAQRGLAVTRKVVFIGETAPGDDGEDVIRGYNEQGFVLLQNSIEPVDPELLSPI
jgi:hypothetical protein